VDVRRKRWWTVLSSALLVSCATAGGLDRPSIGIRDFGSWDHDQDGVVDNFEWDSGFAESGLFEVWDRDSSRYIDRSEWITGPVDWYVEHVGYWYDWDWDDDQRLDRREFGNALFQAWDDDENARIDSDEFETGVNAL
jgi:hypothetical protein